MLNVDVWICFYFVRFRPATVKALIHDVLNEEIGNKKYDPEESKEWAKEVTDALLEKLKGKAEGKRMKEKKKIKLKDIGKKL